ncbi:hypothetical protein [Evansella tamaricis]|uniref:Uncharacterized protein n=1 Tax=Evansella tamaricis TaxID=2069301 RepID=A0ABS6JNL4_9BACI|nr:hypothetical protein [Evansella tamaricis]MBU9714412.1 hypothetical protein [Evansella tamaricis]
MDFIIIIWGIIKDKKEISMTYKFVFSTAPSDDEKENNLSLEEVEKILYSMIINHYKLHYKKKDES